MPDLTLRPMSLNITTQFKLQYSSVYHGTLCIKLCGGVHKYINYAIILCKASLL